MRKKVGIIKRVTCIVLVFLLSINSFAAIVSDNDGSAFITKAEFDALRSSYQSQIDQYNQSIDSKIDGAIASYLAGIKLSTEDELTPLIDKQKYRNILWKYATTYESDRTPFNGKWSCTYFRTGPNGANVPVAGKLVGGTINSCRNKVPQYKDNIISGKSVNATKLVDLKQSVHAAYDGGYSFAGFLQNSGMRDYTSIFAMPISYHAWTSWNATTPIPASNMDVLSALGWSNPQWGYAATDTFDFDYLSSAISAATTCIRVTASSTRTTKKQADFIWPGSTFTDQYGNRRIIIYGHDPVTDAVTYGASVNNTQVGNSRVVDFTFSSEHDDLIVGNVKYPPTELIITDTKNPGEVVMDWSTTSKPLTDFLDITGYGFLAKGTVGATADACTDWNSIQWTTFPTECINGPVYLGASYKTGTTTKDGWCNIGQANWLGIDNIFFYENVLPLFKRIFFSKDSMTASSTAFDNYINQKGIYNGTPLCMTTKTGTIKVTLPLKLVKGATGNVKLWVTKGPIEDDGDLTKTTTGTGFVSNKYTISGATNADKSLQFSLSSSVTTKTFSFEVEKDDVVYLHIIPTSDQQSKEIAAELQNLKIDITYN